MRYRLISAIICLALGVLAWAQATAPPQPVLPEQWVIEQRGAADVTGDGAVDTVYLAGFRNLPDTTFASEHQLIILEGRSGRQINFPLGPDSGGYPGTLFLGRITGDRVADILVGVPTGGSGGVTVYYPITAAGGTPSNIVDPQTFNNGPGWRVNLVRDFRARVESLQPARTFLLDLTALTGQLPEGIYQGVYAPNGDLLRPTTGVVDPYGVVEARDIDRNGLYELIGYQSIWVIAHVNTIGFGRSVWRWTPQGLRITSVEVMQPYTPSEYARDLGRLNLRTPAIAVPQAVTLYRQRFALAPPFFRQEAFLRFRGFHQTVIAVMNRAFQAEAEQLARAGNFRQVPELARRRNASQEYRDAGVEAVYVSEGMWEVVPRRDFYQTVFGPYLSPEYTEYLALEQREVYSPVARDAALVISLTELGRRVHAWETYLLTYPNSPFTAKAQRYYRNGLDIFLYGANNTPHFDYTTKKMRPGVAQVMDWYVGAYPNTPSANEVERVLALYERYDYTMTPELQAELQRLQQR